MGLVDCVWVTLGVLTNKKPSEIDTALQVVQPRPQPGTFGVSLSTVADLLEALQSSSTTKSTSIHPAYSGNVEGVAQDLASFQKTKKVGVLYTRHDGTQHCVVYQYVMEPSPPELEKRYSHSKRPARPGTPKRWEFVDYQGQPKGVSCRQDVEGATRVNGLFAVSPSPNDSSAKHGRPPLEEDIKSLEREGRRKSDEQAKKARRDAELRKRRGIDDLMDLDDDDEA